MNVLEKVLLNVSNVFVPILDGAISPREYTPIELSHANPDLLNIDITHPGECQNYIDTIVQERKARVAYGGYLEKRNLYNDKSLFAATKALSRNIHLGMDFWASAGTSILVPFDGKVHSFKNNSHHGDYGPTLILRHEVNGIHFHTLFGHLSLESIKDLYVGKKFHKGEILATLGDSMVNGGYAPHLHFQIIHKMEGMQGDYPGVCHEMDKDHYSKNCPNPAILLNLHVR